MRNLCKHGNIYISGGEQSTRHQSDRLFAPSYAVNSKWLHTSCVHVTIYFLGNKIGLKVWVWVDVDVGVECKHKQDPYTHNLHHISHMHTYTLTFGI
jgi:hypothetical protein